MSHDLLSAAGGLVAGVLLSALFLLGRLARERRQSATLRAQLAEAGVAQTRLADLRSHLSGLRHDIRGILSPALLVSDKLLAHAEPGVRRAGEVMVRTVERTTTRLGETRLDQDGANSPQP